MNFFLHSKAASLARVAAIALGLAVTSQSAYAQHITAQDPGIEAISFAGQIGKIEKFAEICGAPSSTYSEVVSTARRYANTLYSRAGYPATGIQTDILSGRNSVETSARYRNDYPNCQAFRRIVSSLKNRLGPSSGARAPLAPYDTAGWQARVRAAEKKSTF